MQVKLNSLNNDKKLPNKVSFGQKGKHDPERLLTEKTMKVISDAIAAAGIAGIELQKYTQDFAQNFDKEICRSELKNIDADAIAEAMEYAPGLVDTILTDKSGTGRTRTLNSDTLKSLIDTYNMDSELTEKLLLEKDEKGNYKYSAFQINSLVEINREIPELYSLALENPVFVNNAVNIYGSNNKPLYGIDDIKNFYDISKLNTDFTLKLMKYKDFEGKARFNPEQIKYFVENYDKKDEFLSFILDSKRPLNAERYRFSTEQIMELTQIAKDKNSQKLVQNLMKEYSKEYNYGGMPCFLASDVILDILKNPEMSFSEIVKKTKDAKNLSLQVYALLNGRIDSDKLEEILSLRNNYKAKIYQPQDLLKQPYLFTKKANAEIKKMCNK